MENIKAEEVITHSKSNVIGNIKSKVASLGGKLKGNVNSDQITIKKQQILKVSYIKKPYLFMKVHS